MRPLPSLNDLSPQPAVYDQQKDGFVQAFASNFNQQDSLGSAAAAGQQTVYAGLDPISQAIDAVGSMLDEAMNVFDLLSGSLDAVNLDPVIENFRANDQALDSNLSGFTVDTGSIATGLYDDIYNLFSTFAAGLLAIVQDLINTVLTGIEALEKTVAGLEFAIF